MGLAYTPDSEPENKGMSIIDRLQTLKECKLKFFSFHIDEKGGAIEFCKYPAHIKDTREIFWSPIYPYER